MITYSQAKACIDKIIDSSPIIQNKITLKNEFEKYMTNIGMGSSNVEVSLRNMIIFLNNYINFSNCYYSYNAKVAITKNPSAAEGDSKYNISSSLTKDTVRNDVDDNRLSCQYDDYPTANDLNQLIISMCQNVDNNKVTNCIFQCEQ